MKPIMFILARIFGRRIIGTHLITYHWRDKYWIWKITDKKMYACRNCNRKINEREYNARSGVCQRCWGQVKHG